MVAGSVQAGLLGDLGRLVGGSGEDIGKAALERLQREAGYKVLRSILWNAGYNGADDYANAVKALVEYHDWGAATAAFFAGLDTDGSEEARNVLRTMYAAAVTVRLTNASVANEVVTFVEYINARYSF
jgi:hypothetical protein